jgi:hypothetical protein
MTYIFLPETNIIYIATLVVLSFVKGCVHLSFEFFFKKDLLPTLFANLTQKFFGVHNSTPEYASTANISTTPPSP